MKDASHVLSVFIFLITLFGCLYLIFEVSLVCCAFIWNNMWEQLLKSL